MTSDTKVPPYMTLNNGQKVSSIALGCYNPDDPPGIVHGIEAAVKVGYTHFDDAALYKNEKEVGDALRASGIPREKLFVTTKIWNFDHHNVEAAFDRSFDALNLGYIDMYLLHWPQANVPGEKHIVDDSISFVDTWKQLEKLLETRAGKVKGIGVSNFSLKNLTELLKHAKVVPAMNQVETHPYNQESDLVKFCQEKGILVTAYSPLGLTNSPILKDEDVIAISKEIGNGVTPANVVLNWNVQRGVAVLPKSINADRVKENFRIVHLTDEQMQRLNDISKDPKRRFQRTCPVYNEDTKKVLGWTYDQLGWDKPIQMTQA